MNEEIGCCGDDRIVIKRTVITGKELSTANSSLLKIKTSLSKNIIDFRALSARNGNFRRLSQSRRNVFGNESIKAGGLGRAGHTLASIAIPGDTDPLRSPVRSAVYRTLTPGFGRGKLSGSKPNRGYRCPEGYQYGGRFTDSRLSTCGAKLFDIPSPLRAAIAAITQRNERMRKPEAVTGTPLGAGPAGGPLIDSRKPQIPKVSTQNLRELEARKNELIRDMARHRQKVSRMVRRDGFVLEPVVPPSVLRAIPDNRDMEGATYLMSAFGPPDIGNDELGMLSNTGIQRLIYVMPSGGTFTLEKKRQLTVGERRKLGKVVNVAMEKDNSDDPAARLKMIADEIGEGIGLTEDLGNAKTTSRLFARGRASSSEQDAEETPSIPVNKKKIKSVKEAIAALANGIPLSNVDQSILSEVLSKSSSVKRTRLANNQALLEVSGKKYLEYSRPTKFQHLGEYYSTMLQRHLGLAAPEILFTGKPGESRIYLRTDIADAIPGSELDPSARLEDFDPQDIARMMIADYLMDQRTRPLTSVYAMRSASGSKPVLAGNTSATLVGIDAGSLAKRSKMSISDFYLAEQKQKINYKEIYSKLNEEQKLATARFIDSLIRRAGELKLAEIRKRLGVMGLTDAEQAHINIVEKIFESRLEMLKTKRQDIRKLFGD